MRKIKAPTLISEMVDTGGTGTVVSLRRRPIISNFCLPLNLIHHKPADLRSILSIIERTPPIGIVPETQRFVSKLWLTISKATGENEPDLEVEVVLNGKVLKEVKINKKNLFNFDNKLVLEGDAVDTGDHKLELRKKGKGPLYFNAYLTNFTLEDFITKAGLEVKVNRSYFKLVPKTSRLKMLAQEGSRLIKKLRSSKKSGWQRR